MDAEDTTATPPEVPETAAEQSPATDTTTEAEDEAAAQANAWFNDDDDEAAPTEKTAAAEESAESPEPADAPAKPADATPKPPPTKEPVAEAAPAAEPPVPAPEPAADCDAIQAAVKDLPGKIKVGGKDVDVSALVTDFPEIAPLAATIADRIVEQRLAPFIEMLQTAQVQQQRETFLSRVAEKAPNVREVIATKEFREWVEKQPAPLRKMASADDVDSAVFVLQQYTTTAARKPTATRAPVAPSPAFEKRKAATSGTLPGKAASRAGGGTPDPSDYEAAFNEP